MADIPLKDIDETLYLMQRRLEQGQGTRQDAMCRLSLTMSLALRKHLEAALDILIGAGLYDPEIVPAEILGEHDFAGDKDDCLKCGEGRCHYLHHRVCIGCPGRVPSGWDSEFCADCIDAASRKEAGL